MKVSAIITRPPFNELFTISPAVLENIKLAMAEGGYDQSQPIVLWEGENVVIDGHTRLQAAREVGLDDIPVFYKRFADEGEALAYAIHNQRNRRNLTDAEILRCIEALDRRKGRGGDRKSEEFQEKSKASSDAIDQQESPKKRKKNNSEDKSAQKTAATVGTSTRKVEKARTVLEHADEEVKEAVQAGEMSINKAYQVTQATRQARDKGRSVFNRTNDNIEWACWTWNPVTGCKHDCPYCYARDIAARFYGNDKFDPKFHPERLGGPANTRPPQDGAPIGERNVFVCSMADLFGAWVPQEWIDAVMKEVWEASQWNFLFLTKNPGRLVGIDWPPNAWVGTTVDRQERVAAAEKAFAKIKATVKFLSCEPLLEKVRFQNLKVFDWIIIGPRRVGKEHEQPQWEWVESLLNQARAAGLQVYFKPHLSVRPREYPEKGIREVSS
jgi:protein gp37